MESAAGAGVRAPTGADAVMDAAEEKEEACWEKFCVRSSTIQQLLPRPRPTHLLRVQPTPAMKMKKNGDLLILQKGNPVTFLTLRRDHGHRPGRLAVKALTPLRKPQTRCFTVLEKA